MNTKELAKALQGIIEGKFEIKTNALSFESYDIINDTYTTLGTRLSLDVGQSYILYLSKEKAEEKRELKPLTLEKHFEVKGEALNYITLDTLSYSKDGVNYSDKRHHMCALDELLKDRYEGRLYLKYDVKINTPPSTCALLAEKAEGMRSYSTWDGSYHRNCQLQADYAWNHGGTGMPSAATARYARRYFPNAQGQANDVREQHLQRKRP